MYHECRHIFTGGRKCQSPALTDQSFCYFHSNTRKRPTPKNTPYKHTPPKETALDLPPLEDADAIQLALSDVVLALAANTIDPRRARILIYGLQAASQNLRHRRVPQVCEAGVPNARGVRGLGWEGDLGVQTVRETHRHEDGTLIGPAKQSPDPEEKAERKRPPSLGEILLREVELMKKQKAEEERRQREAAAAQAAQMSFNLPADDALEIQAVADSTNRCHPERSAQRAVEGPARTKFVRSLARQGPHFSPRPHRLIPNHS
jgi:hypothetical protein